MQFKNILVALVISFLSTVVALPVTPEIVPIGKQTCAVADTSGRTLVFFQAADNSLVFRFGIGLASNSYTPTTILAGNIAKSGTPLACVLLDPTNVSTVRLYYIGTIANGLVDGLHELVPVNGNTGLYAPGTLDGGPTAAPSTLYMYAVRNTDGGPRLGFQCQGGQTCEFRANAADNGYTFTILDW